MTTDPAARGTYDEHGMRSGSVAARPLAPRKGGKISERASASPAAALSAAGGDAGSSSGAYYGGKNGRGGARHAVGMMRQGTR